MSGFWLTSALVGELALFGSFSLTLALNLVRGRRDLSCHCGGLVGNHLISWWLVGRNGLLLTSLLVLLLTPPDRYTVAAFVQNPSLWSRFPGEYLSPYGHCGRCACCCYRAALNSAILMALLSIACYDTKGCVLSCPQSG